MKCASGHVAAVRQHVRTENRGQTERFLSKLSNLYSATTKKSLLTKPMVFSNASYCSNPCLARNARVPRDPPATTMQQAGSGIQC
jgi:hypothetical protein